MAAVLTPATRQAQIEIGVFLFFRKAEKGRCSAGRPHVATRGDWGDWKSTVMTIRKNWERLRDARLIDSSTLCRRDDENLSTKQGNSLTNTSTSCSFAILVCSHAGAAHNDCLQM